MQFSNMALIYSKCRPSIRSIVIHMQNRPQHAPFLPSMHHSVTSHFSEASQDGRLGTSLTTGLKNTAQQVYFCCVLSNYHVKTSQANHAYAGRSMMVETHGNWPRKGLTHSLFTAHVQLAMHADWSYVQWCLPKKTLFHYHLALVYILRRKLMEKCLFDLSVSVNSIGNSTKISKSKLKSELHILCYVGRIFSPVT